jgi:acetylornithine deacetylase/succinyl-diaminopimelate desuccinylase-like protein
MVSGVLKVEILTEGVHSGDSSGLVPSSFRILRQVLDRLEDSATGWIIPSAFHVQIPPERVAQAAEAAAILGDIVFRKYPFASGTRPMVDDAAEGLLNRTWRPALSVIGADGLPPIADAGNVLRPVTALELSLRLPPLVDGNAAAASLKQLLEDNAPYNAKVTFSPDGRAGAFGATGWNAPSLAPWLESALNTASQAHYGAPCGYIGQGGTIPLMSMLQKSFPAAQMMVCGVLGPKSNAHGPNEFLHVPYGKKLTAAVAQVMAACP